MLLIVTGCSLSNNRTSDEGNEQAVNLESTNSASVSTENSTIPSHTNDSVSDIISTTDKRSGNEEDLNSGTDNGKEPIETSKQSNSGHNSNNTEKPQNTKPANSYNNSTTLRSTTTPNRPPAQSTTAQQNMDKEYKRIIRETISYAEGYKSKGFTFVWDESLEFNNETGYMGTPRVEYEGVNGVIEVLKHHIDLIVKTATDSSNGIPSYSANYKVVQVEIDGDIAFVVLYE